MKKKIYKYIIFLLVASLVWLFVNQALYRHSHLLFDGQVVTHAHPYTPDKTHSPFQSHKHLPSVAFFLDLITSLNIDTFTFHPLLPFLLTVLAILYGRHFIPSYQEYAYSGADRAPPVMR